MNTSIFVGRSFYTKKMIGIPGENGMLTFAGSRGGKGAAASIPNLLVWPHSAVVVDVKGTHAAVTARYRRDVLKQKVYIVDPFNIVKQQNIRQETARFNPLETVKDPDVPDIRERIGMIADALVVPAPAGTDPHWDLGAKTILSGFIGHIITAFKDKNPALSMIRTLAAKNADEQSLLLADMLLNDGAGGAARDAAVRITRGIETNEILGIPSNVDKHSK